MPLDNTSRKDITQPAEHLTNHFPPTYIFNRDGTCISALGISDAHNIDIECFLGDNLGDILPKPIADRLYSQLLTSIDSMAPQRDEMLLPISGSTHQHWFLSEFLPLSTSPYQPVTVMWKLTDIHEYIAKNESLLRSQLVEQEYAISNEQFLISELYEELKLIKQYGGELAILNMRLAKVMPKSPLPLADFISLEQTLLSHIESMLTNGQTLSRLGQHRYVILQPGVSELKAKLVAALLIEELNELLQETGYEVKVGVVPISKLRLGPIKVNQSLAYQLIDEAASRTA